MEHTQLQLTPDNEAKREAEQLAHQIAYRRAYWQNYKKQHKRVYGTLTPEEYEAIKVLADENGRSVWEEVWEQSRAYREKQFLPSEAINDEIGKLYVELRRIGNNLNQIAHHGNIFKRASNPHQVLKQLEAMENSIAHFVAKPWTN